ncbi:MAG: toll/interleukin-1 receptor domain-containing protein [Pseudomonadota bacterium]
MEDDTGDSTVVEQAREQSFSAFISYSHADAAAVRKLHSRIEAYRLPKGLGGIDTLNQKGKGVGKVFRDREDLSAAQDLSLAVKDALDRSGVLVVACSPDAKASRWVNQEIEYFCERYPDRPVLAAILRGEPEEAFPAALIRDGAEPLAADLRKQGDGKRLGFLKVVAGIAGVPLDRLVQRDSQRELRRVMAITGMVALIAIATSVMTMIAIQARSDAEAQRDEAERVIAYLMTDLRTQLKGVNRYDVMRGVNETALEYYTRQGDLSDLPPKSLEQRAEILHAMGEDDEASGNLEAALTKFLEAHRATEELIKREPDNPDRIFAHSQSEYWVGFAAWRETKPEIAKPHWQSYYDLSERLLSFDGSNSDWIMEAGFAASNLGLIAMRAEGNFDAARKLFLKALDYFLSAQGNQPGDAGIAAEVADAHAWVADAHRAQGDFAKALEQREKERLVLVKLVGDHPKNAVYQRDLIGNAIGTAQAQLDAGLRGKASALLGRTMGSVRDLARTFPKDAKLQLQERLVGLLLAKAAPLNDPTANKTLQNCATDKLVQAEEELAAFCSVLRKRAGVTGEGEAATFTSPFPNMHLTPRWGLEL